MLHCKTEQIRFFSSKTNRAQAIAIDCGEIILPVTPPVVFLQREALQIRRLVAVMACKFENSAFADVSDPVRNTPIQPKNGEKNGNSPPVPANANANVEDRPNSLR